MPESTELKVWCLIAGPQDPARYVCAVSSYRAREKAGVSRRVEVLPAFRFNGITFDDVIDRKTLDALWRQRNA